MMRALVLMVVVVAAGCGPRVMDPACEAYVACQAAFDAAADVEPVDTSPYALEGDCWGGDPRSADRCALECAESLAFVQQAAADADLTLDACAVEVDA